MTGVTRDAATATRTTPTWVWLAAEERARWTLAAWISGIATFVVLNVSLAALVFDDVADRDGLEDLDQPTLEAAIEARTPFWDSVITFYSYLGGPVVAIVATFLAVVGLGLLWKTWTPFLLMLVAGGGLAGHVHDEQGLHRPRAARRRRSPSPRSSRRSASPAATRSTRRSSPASSRTC